MTPVYSMGRILNMYMDVDVAGLQSLDHVLD